MKTILLSISLLLAQTRVVVARTPIEGARRVESRLGPGIFQLPSRMIDWREMIQEQDSATSCRRCALSAMSASAKVSTRSRRRSARLWRRRPRRRIFGRQDLIIGRARHRVIVTGIGKSGHIARKIAATLASTGEPAFFVHPAEAEPRRPRHGADGRCGARYLLVGRDGRARGDRHFRQALCDPAHRHDRGGQQHAWAGRPTSA